MSFTSRRGVERPGRPARRDRNGLVGLSGWLFADLLLGVAVIFLVGSEVPQKGLEGRGASLGVRIETVDETVQKTSGAWGVRDETFKLNIIFTEEVRNFEIEDIVVSGDADQWVASFFDEESKDGVGDEFTIELTPKSGLNDGSFVVGIPADAAFNKDGSGNVAVSQDFAVVTCFRYTGIDAERGLRIPLKGAANGSVDSLLRALNQNDDIEQAKKLKKKIGLMIIFGGGSQGSSIAERNKENLIQAFKELELVPSGETATCGQVGSEKELPTLRYKDEGLDTRDLDLRLYFLTKTGN